MAPNDYLLLATEDEAEQLVSTMNPLELRRGLYLGDHHATTLSSLFVALGAASEAPEKLFRELVVDDPDDGPFVYCVSQGFTRRMCEVAGDAQAEEVVQRWKQDSALEYFEDAELVVFVKKLHELCVLAQRERSPLLYWSSL